jgi:hypothetical protein
MSCDMRQWISISSARVTYVNASESLARVRSVRCYADGCRCLAVQRADGLAEGHTDEDWFGCAASCVGKTPLTDRENVVALLRLGWRVLGIGWCWLLGGDWAGRTGLRGGEW